MRWAAQWLRKWADRLDPPPQPVNTDAFLVRALDYVREAEAFSPGTSGEFKRHWVYGKLLKAFPGMSKRAASRLLEEAVARVHGD